MSGDRLVKCPTCRQLLKEPAGVSVYRCGGCDTMLQAKTPNLMRKNATFGGTEGSSMNSPDAASFMNISSLPKETIPHSGEMGHELGTEASQVEKVSVTEHFVGSRTNDSSASDVVTNEDRKNQEPYDSFNSEAKESLGHGNLKQGAAETDKGTTTDGHTSEDSFSSCDEEDYQSNDEKPKVLEDSLVLDTVDSIGYKERKGHSDQSMDTGSQVQALVPTEKTSAGNEESQAKSRTSAGKDTPVGGKAFRSVKNQLELAKDVYYLRSLSADAVLQKNRLKTQPECLLKMYATLSNGQKEIITKIDELRDEMKTLQTREKDSFRHSESHPRPSRPRETVPQQSCFARNPIPFPPASKPCKKRQNAAPGIAYPSSSGRDSSRYLPDNSVTKKAPGRPPSYPNARVSSEHRQNVHSKRKQSKHHCRPILGGAPFVICYRCLELLQVPMESVVSRKRMHKLRCSTCSQVLIFESQAAAQSIITRSPSEVPHPPSEVDGSADSLSASYSLVRLREESSSKLEKMKDEAANNSRLHRLMGYDSASELLYKHSDSDEGLEKMKLTSHSISQMKGKSKV